MEVDARRDMTQLGDQGNRGPGDQEGERDHSLYTGLRDFVSFWGRLVLIPSFFK
jgi:hypothetical protein